MVDRFPSLTSAVGAELTVVCPMIQLNCAWLTPPPTLPASAEPPVSFLPDGFVAMHMRSCRILLFVQGAVDEVSPAAALCCFFARSPRSYRCLSLRWKRHLRLHVTLAGHVPSWCMAGEGHDAALDCIEYESVHEFVEHLQQGAAHHDLRVTVIDDHAMQGVVLAKP